MTDKSIEYRFQAAQVLIREAGIFALKLFRNSELLNPQKKANHDWVSEADREVENFIKTKLGLLFPEDGFLGEESGILVKKETGIWVVDPIDGTTCFLKGISSWCISIAFVLKKEVEIGLIYSPCMDELFAVKRKFGATLNGHPMKPSSAKSLSEGIVGIGYSPKKSISATKKAFEYLFRKGGIYQDIGSAALMIAYVAAGRYIGFYEFHLNSWDCLAGLAMVRETGGWTNNFLANNGLNNGNPVLASSPGTKNEMLNLFSCAGH